MKRFITLAACVLCATSCATDPAHDVMLPEKEQLTQWAEEDIRESHDPAREHSAAPKVGERVADIDLTGTWRNDYGFGATILTFTPTDSDQYDVHFYSVGCLFGFTLERKATCAGSTITFDRAVREYSPCYYQRMHVVNVDGVVYLVASENVTRLERDRDEPREIYELWLLKKQQDG